MGTHDGVGAFGGETHAGETALGVVVAAIAAAADCHEEDESARRPASACTLPPGFSSAAGSNDVSHYMLFKWYFRRLYILLVVFPSICDQTETSFRLVLCPHVDVFKDVSNGSLG